MQMRKERLCILVKAYPQPSQKYEETVCCAAVSQNGDFLRLYPIPYRHLKPEQKFDRYDVIEADIFKTTDDWRPESHKVVPESIRILQHGNSLSSVEKVRLWSGFVVESLTALKKENETTERSLGIVKPDPDTIRFWAKPVEKNSDIFASLFHQASLFNESLKKLKQEYVFGYAFTSGGHRHDMKIHDWEVQAAYFNYKKRYAAETLDKLKAMYGEEIPQNNLHFILGTMKAHPRQFIIIGLLRGDVSPEEAQQQMQLF